MKYPKSDIELAKKDLLEDDLIKENDTIYMVLKYKSDSGVTRIIDIFIINDNKPLRITWQVARLTDLKEDNNYNGVVVKGAGMDMGLWLVNDISRALFDKISLKHQWL